MTVERIETIYGPMFVPSTDSGQYYWLKNLGASPEDEQIESVCEMIAQREERGYAIDVGANFGCWTLGLAREAWGVVAFEPQPGVFGLLEKSIAYSPHRNRIRAFNLALGPARGLIEVPILPLERTSNFGGVVLGKRHDEHPDAPMIGVEVARLDDCLMPDGPVSFVKVDVEGAERGVLEGARKTIKRWKPIIVAEADHPRTDRVDLGNFIESLGYNVEIFMDGNFIGMPL